MISNEMDPLVVNSGAAALDLIARQSSTLDMILMDITLGDMEGFDVIQTIRRNGVTTPVIIISGRNEDYDFMYGLSLGADDYVTKPYSSKVLAARIAARLRKKSAAPPETRTVTLGALTIDLIAYRAELNGRPLMLTADEFKTLALLTSNPGRVFTRNQIIREVKGDNYSVTARAIDMHIVNLRKKLGEWADRIETVRGIGYKAAGE